MIIFQKLQKQMRSVVEQELTHSPSMDYQQEQQLITVTPITAPLQQEEVLKELRISPSEAITPPVMTMLTLRGLIMPIYTVRLEMIS